MVWVGGSDSEGLREQLCLALSFSFCRERV